MAGFMSHINLFRMFIHSNSSKSSDYIVWNFVPQTTMSFVFCTKINDLVLRTWGGNARGERSAVRDNSRRPGAPHSLGLVCGTVDTRVSASEWGGAAHATLLPPPPLSLSTARVLPVPRFSWSTLLPLLKVTEHAWGGFGPYGGSTFKTNGHKLDVFFTWIKYCFAWLHLLLSWTADFKVLNSLSHLISKYPWNEIIKCVRAQLFLVYKTVNRPDKAECHGQWVEVFRFRFIQKVPIEE